MKKWVTNFKRGKFCVEDVKTVSCVNTLKYRFNQVHDLIISDCLIGRKRTSETQFTSIWIWKKFCKMYPHECWWNQALRSKMLTSWAVFLPWKNLGTFLRPRKKNGSQSFSKPKGISCSKICWKSLALLPISELKTRKIIRLNSGKLFFMFLNILSDFINLHMPIISYLYNSCAIEEKNQVMMI